MEATRVEKYGYRMYDEVVLSARVIAEKAAWGIGRGAVASITVDINAGSRQTAAMILSRRARVRSTCAGDIVRGST